ncbi:MAG: dolichol-P-glucose synthetase [Nitrosomonas sp.]|nr:MAG: dolichol-P-glucose synthetase [Nitrosomonas sp.]
MIQNGAVEFTLLMPCLNEQETLAICIQKAHRGAENAGITSYEVLISDNGSSDGSQQIAQSLGARVVHTSERGYGAAIRQGISEAFGKFVIMADADDSYDWSSISEFVEKLRQGHDLVVGTRLKGEIKPNAMPFLHRYLGNPVLTFFGNLFYRVNLSDFHCGMRGFRKDAIQELGLNTSGMEFASEMLIKSAQADLKRAEVPITLYPDGRSRPPHLRTWRDGWRHLRFMLLFSPRWLFIYPGIIASIIGLTIMLLLIPGLVAVGGVEFDVHTLLIGAMLLVVGTQTIGIGVIARVTAARLGLLPTNIALEKKLERFSLELGLTIGLLLFLFGILAISAAVFQWGQTNFGPLDYQHTLRILIPGVTLCTLGLQAFFFSFLVSLFDLPVTDGQLFGKKK